MSRLTQTLPDEMPHPTMASRRGLLRGAGLAAAGSILMQPKDVFALAQEAEEDAVKQAVSEHARPTSFGPEVRNLPRWTPKQTGNYNLSDPHDNFFAFAKAQCNLAGEYSWMAQYGWLLIAPPGKPAYPFLGRIQLMQYFASPATPDLVPNPDENAYILWGTFTTTHVDPRNFKPIERIMNPYTGKMIDLPVIRYADRLAFRQGESIIVPGVDPAFYDQPWDRDGGYSQHYIDAGDDITYTVLGSAQHDGPHQPRLDVGFWSVTRDDLMNPSMPSIDTRRDYSAIMKLSEYAWYGVEQGDQAQLAVHTTGIKTQNLARIPGFVKEQVLERFSDRYDF